MYKLISKDPSLKGTVTDKQYAYLPPIDQRKYVNVGFDDDQVNQQEDEDNESVNLLAGVLAAEALEDYLDEDDDFENYDI